MQVTQPLSHSCQTAGPQQPQGCCISSTVINISIIAITTITALGMLFITPFALGATLSTATVLVGASVLSLFCCGDTSTTSMPSPPIPTPVARLQSHSIHPSFFGSVGSSTRVVTLPPPPADERSHPRRSSIHLPPPPANGSRRSSPLVGHTALPPPPATRFPPMGHGAALSPPRRSIPGVRARSSFESGTVPGAR